MSDPRQARLYGEKPIVIPEEKYQDIVDYYIKCYTNSDEWFRRNYEHEFIRFYANYLSIPGDNQYKPWPTANDYFMPSTNIAIENYVARQVGTIKGAKEFVSVLPRGKDDEKKAEASQSILRYYFENPMEGFQKAVTSFRNTDIYGTSIAAMPWSYEIYKVEIPGVYLWDTETEKYVVEVDFQGDEEAPPMNFASVEDLSVVLAENPNFKKRKLFEDVVIKDCPDLQILDLLNVRVDPNGGPDIQKHEYVIIESIETRDTLRRKAENGIYDKDQVDKLLRKLNPDRTLRLSDKNQGQQERDNIERKITNIGKRGGLLVKTCYGKHKVDFSTNVDGTEPMDVFEEECISIIVEDLELVKMGITPFTRKGIPYRPLLVDRFIELPNRFYGVGPAQILEPLNYVLNHLVNQVLNQGDLFNAAPLITPLDSDFDPQFVSYGPAQTWQSDNPDGFKLLPVPDVKSSQMQMIIFFQEFIQKSLGINDFTTGGQGSQHNQTARGIASVIREVNRRIDFYAAGSHNNFYKKMFEMMMWQLQEFMSPDELPRITDASEKEIDIVAVFGDGLDIDADVKVRSDLLTATREVERAQTKELLEIALKSRDEDTGQFILDIVEITDLLAKTYPDVVDKEALINPEVRAKRDQQKAMNAQQDQGGVPAQGGVPNPQGPNVPNPNPEGGIGAV